MGERLAEFEVVDPAGRVDAREDVSPALQRRKLGLELPVALAVVAPGAMPAMVMDAVIATALVFTFIP